MAEPWTDADVELVAERLHKLDERMWSPQHRVTWREETAEEQAAYRATAVEVVSALAAAGQLRTVEHGRRLRAAAIREAIGAVAVHGPISGARWMEELERFAQIVEQPEEDTRG